jgi:hypothetical protein
VATHALSASETLRVAVGHSESWIADENAEILALIRAQLDDATFERAWTDGKRMPVTQILELARPG